MRGKYSDILLCFRIDKAALLGHQSIDSIINPDNDTDADQGQYPHLRKITLSLCINLTIQV